MTAGDFTVRICLCMMFVIGCSVQAPEEQYASIVEEVLSILGENVDNAEEASKQVDRFLAENRARLTNIIREFEGMGTVRAAKAFNETLRWRKRLLHFLQEHVDIGKNKAIQNTVKYFLP